MEGSLVAYKVFTNGSTLQASELNENLMQQSIAVFSNAAARTAAITSPVEGQMTYLDDVDRYDHWNGSAWVSPFGLTKLLDSTFTGQTSVSINNVFSSTYRNYKVLLNVAQKSTNSSMNLRFRASGSDAITNYNFGGSHFRTSATAVAFGGDNTSLVRIGASNVLSSSYSIEVFNPFLAQNTEATINAFGGDLSTWFSTFSGGNQTSSTSFDGFTILPDNGTIGGSLRVYGYRS
jgi:hypothetical protein